MFATSPLPYRVDPSPLAVCYLPPLSPVITASYLPPACPPCPLSYTISTHPPIYLLPAHSRTHHQYTPSQRSSPHTPPHPLPPPSPPPSPHPSPDPSAHPSGAAPAPLCNLHRLESRHAQAPRTSACYAPGLPHMHPYPTPAHAHAPLPLHPYPTPTLPLPLTLTLPLSPKAFLFDHPRSVQGLLPQATPA